MLKVEVPDTVAKNVLRGEQNIIVTDHDYNGAGDLITLVDKDTNKPILYASLDYCVCDVADHLFNRLKNKIRNFTWQDFHQAIHNGKLAFVLKISQPQPI